MIIRADAAAGGDPTVMHSMRLNVLHVILTMAPAYGGPVSACDAYCRHLAALGHNVALYTTTAGPSPGTLDEVALRGDAPERPYELQRFPILDRFYAVSPALWQALNRRLPLCDVVHIHGLYRFPGFAAATLARRHDKPYIVRPFGCLNPYGRAQRRNWHLKHGYEYLVEFPQLNRANLIQYTAEDERTLAAPIGLRTPTVILPPAVDLAPFDPVPMRGTARSRLGIGEAPMILFLGRIARKKGLDILVRSLPTVVARHPAAVLVVAGPDTEGLGNAARALARELGIADRLLFTGMVEGRAKIELLADADVFVLSSLSENFGIAVVEAMAAGTPSVVSHEVALWRDIEASGGGLAVPLEEAAVARAIDALLSESDRAPRRAAAQAFAARFAAPRVVGDLVEVYRGLIASRSARAPR